MIAGGGLLRNNKDRFDRNRNLLQNATTGLY
jgi:hypothetical protein